MLGRQPEALTDAQSGSGLPFLTLFGDPNAPDLTPALYSYNDKSQMVEAANGNTVVNNSFNAEGCRASKTAGPLTTYYCYEYDRVIMELDSQSVAAYNVYGVSLISRDVGGDKVYYLYNGHGDVTGLVKANGTVVASYYYDAFGVILEETGSYQNPFRYSGYYFDSGVELYNLHARFYDAKLARFMQEDSYLGDRSDPLSLNLYTYCSNNPLIYWDPTGHVSQTVIVDANGKQGTGYIIDGYTYLDRAGTQRVPEGTYADTDDGWYQLQNGVGVKVDGPPPPPPPPQNTGNSSSYDDESSYSGGTTSTTKNSGSSNVDTSSSAYNAWQGGWIPYDTYAANAIACGKTPVPKPSPTSNVEPQQQAPNSIYGNATGDGTTPSNTAPLVADSTAGPASTKNSGGTSNKSTDKIIDIIGELPGYCSYVLYDPNAEAKDNGAVTRANAIQIAIELTAYYGTTTRVVPVDSRESFVDVWNDIIGFDSNGNNVGIDAVVIHTHAWARGIYFYGSDTGQITPQDFEGLHQKNMSMLILLGCNTGDSWDNVNLPTNIMLSQQGIQNIIAGCGKVGTGINNTFWRQQIMVVTVNDPPSYQPDRISFGMKIYFRDSAGNFIDDKNHIMPIGTVDTIYFGMSDLIEKSALAKTR